VTAGTYLGDRGRLNGNLAYVGVTSNRDGITLDPDNRDEMITFNLAWGHDSRNSWLVPRDGWRNEWLEVSYFGLDANFWVFQIDLNRYIPIREHHSTVLGPLFTYQTGEVGVEVPPYLQYFMGGANTIRGYKLLELGKEIYGKNQFLFNWEYRWNFYPMRVFQILNWKVNFGFQLAGFADAGTAWTRDQDFSLNRTRFGFGGGLRVLLPVLEMVRFDLGVSQYGDVEFNFGVRSIFSGRRDRVR
jgi:outer membrane protein assembly factor BamA